MRNKLPAFVVITSLCFGASNWCVGAEPAVAKNTAALTYKNPLITDGFPADPHVLEVDGTYYLYPTTHTHGYDAWTSTDLVNWKFHGPVFKDPRGGAWAPDVFHNKRGDGKFYLYYTDNVERGRGGLAGKQIGVAVSDSPLGPFEDKKALVGGSIDAHLFQDKDGRYYLYYVEIMDGFKIFVQRMSDPLTPEGERVEVIRPTEPWEKVSGEVTEGPFMLVHGGQYYLMYSGTGADSPNYGIGYATAKSPMGPFTKAAENPIVHRSDESADTKGEKIYGPGHHCVVTGPDGKLWMIYHQKYDDGTNYRRFTALDPIWFDEAGKLRARVTRGTEEQGPGKGAN